MLETQTPRPHSKQVYVKRPQPERSSAIIIGCPRSGTTFLVDAIAAVDHVDAVGGHAFPSQFGAVLNAGLSPDLRSALEFSFRFSLNDNVDYAAGSRSTAVAELLKRNVGLGEALGGLARRRKITGILYKEPFLAFAPEFPYEAVPWSRIVHIHRDGRDAADSLVRTYDVLSDAKLRTLDENELVLGRRIDDHYVPWWVAEGEEEAFLSSSQFVRAVWMWREMVRRCMRFAARADVAKSGRVQIVHYEALVRDPQVVGARVLEHLGFSANRRVKRRFGIGHEESIGIHRRLPKDEISTANALAEAELGALGYL